MTRAADTIATTISCRTHKKSRGRPLGARAKAIRQAVTELTTAYDRMTVRQIFYKLEVGGIVAKTEGGYRQVQTQVLKMRRDGLLAWEFVTDGTRLQRKPETWTGITDFMEDISRAYRRDLWRTQNVRIEVWLEKDALADTIIDVLWKWDVPLMVSRGQSSTTFLYNAAKFAERAWHTNGVETYIYALYDRDAGGRRAAGKIETEIPGYAPGVPIHFELLGVTDEQIVEWNLPTRPAKKSDPEAATFEGPAVELDAIPSEKLCKIVENAIVSHIDDHAWNLEQAVEAEEQQGLLDRIGGVR